MHVRTASITPEEINAAAERLLSRGEKPTLRAVRGEIGGGSLATIQPVLAEWKARRPRIEPTGPAVSPELQRAILGDIERAVAAAKADLTAELAETQDARDALGEELRQQIVTATAAERRAAEALAESERQAGTIATLERALVESREQIVREREAAEGARKEAAQAAVRLESLPTLQAEIETLRRRLDEEREARRVAEIAAAELRGPAAGGGGKKSG
jgi:colicin import membrane protein